METSWGAGTPEGEAGVGRVRLLPRPGLQGGTRCGKTLKRAGCGEVWESQGGTIVLGPVEGTPS